MSTVQICTVATFLFLFSSSTQPLEVHCFHLSVEVQDYLAYKIIVGKIKRYRHTYMFLSRRLEGMFVHPLTPLLTVGIGMKVFEGNEMQIFTSKRFDYLIAVFLLALNKLLLAHCCFQTLIAAQE